MYKSDKLGKHETLIPDSPTDSPARKTDASKPSNIAPPSRGIRCGSRRGADRQFEIAEFIAALESLCRRHGLSLTEVIKGKTRPECQTQLEQWTARMVRRG